MFPETFNEQGKTMTLTLGLKMAYWVQMSTNTLYKKIESTNRVLFRIIMHVHVHAGRTGLPLTLGMSL